MRTPASTNTFISKCCFADLGLPGRQNWVQTSASFFFFSGTSGKAQDVLNITAHLRVCVYVFSPENLNHFQMQWICVSTQIAMSPLFIALWRHTSPCLKGSSKLHWNPSKSQAMHLYPPPCWNSSPEKVCIAKMLIYWGLGVFPLHPQLWDFFRLQGSC